MPMPSRAQAAAKGRNDCACDNSTSAAANRRLDADSTPLPPARSIIRPTFGPIIAEMIRAAEKVPKKRSVEMPMSRDISSANTAGK